jgi:hypothetical protein
MKNLYCPVCRTKLKNKTFCGFCGIELKINVTLTPGTLPEFKEKVLSN